MQKIYIRNNGPIREFEMEVERFNFLIGEQATGKSTVAKSIYFFRMVKTIVLTYMIQLYDMGSQKNAPQEETEMNVAVRKELKGLFVKLFGRSWELNPELQMRYRFADGIWMEVFLGERKKEGKRYINVNYSKELWERINGLKKEVVELKEPVSSAVISLNLEKEQQKRNHERIVQRVNEIFGDDKETYYIPAGRSMLTVMSGNRATMNSAAYLDFVMEQFMRMIDLVRNSFKSGLRKVHQYYPAGQRKFDVNEMADYIIALQKGEYFSSNGREFLKIGGGEESVDINFTSSGQQEILWVLNFLYTLMLKGEKAFVIIEEPEAHIYPALQKKLVEFIAMYANIQEGSVFITTHSPYVLMEANNLYYAGVLAQEGDAKSAGKIIDFKKMIRKGELAAYKLWFQPPNAEERSYKTLFDETGREILTGMVDDVSADINQEYTALYRLELERE